MMSFKSLKPCGKSKNSIIRKIVIPQIYDVMFIVLSIRKSFKSKYLHDEIVYYFKNHIKANIQSSFFKINDIKLRHSHFIRGGRQHPVDDSETFIGFDIPGGHFLALYTGKTVA